MTAPDAFALGGRQADDVSIDALLRTCNSIFVLVDEAEIAANAARDAGDREALVEANKRSDLLSERGSEIVYRIFAINPVRLRDAAQLLVTAIDHSAFRDERDRFDEMSDGAFSRAIEAIQRLTGIERLR